ncbi:transmembrane protein 223 [Conger conger]|uniref:transmembrane protein 223 n=1 Tax=Conger conger TaxID=82655 RepID=UPI002A5AB908|nr:transmembrane protein 223 [Conger conger]
MLTKVFLHSNDTKRIQHRTGKRVGKTYIKIKKMSLRYLLSGVPGSPNRVAQRCTWLIFRTQRAPLRTPVSTPAMNSGSVTHYTSWAPIYRPISLISSLGRNHLSDWFCVTRRPCNATLSSPSTRRRQFGLAALSSTPVRFHSTSSAVAKDVVLFEHDRTRFFRLLSFFCVGQLLFWTYLAHFAFTNLRDTRRSPAGESTAIAAGLFGLEANLGSDTWRYGFTVACLVVAAGIVGFGVLFCRRSVCRVILHKGGRKVTVTTQSPLGPGLGRSLTVPLAQVACVAHRQESPTFIPLRVKGHRFYFLLDREGTLNNHKLFDVTVGAYRPF